MYVPKSILMRRNKKRCVLYHTAPFVLANQSPWLIERIGFIVCNQQSSNKQEDDRQRQAAQQTEGSK